MSIILKRVLKEHSWDVWYCTQKQLKWDRPIWLITKRTGNKKSNEQHSFGFVSFSRLSAHMNEQPYLLPNTSNAFLSCYICYIWLRWMEKLHTYKNLKKKCFNPTLIPILVFFPSQGRLQRDECRTCFQVLCLLLCAPGGEKLSRHYGTRSSPKAEAQKYQKLWSKTRLDNPG